MQLVPDEETFVRLADEGNIIPVYVDVLADMETPISAFRSLAGNGPSYLLESAEGGERFGRYSFIGLLPLFSLESSNGVTWVSYPDTFSQQYSGNPIKALRETMREYRPVAVEGLPRFYGGAVGYFGYDVVRYLERLPGGPRDDRRLPDARFLATEMVVIFDHLKHRLKLVVNAHVNGEPRDAYRRAESLIKSAHDRIKRGVRANGAVGAASGGRGRGRPLVGAGVRRVPERESFLKAVARAKDYIRAGDIFQVVLSMREDRPLQVAPFEVYRALRALNPSPYMFYLDFGDLRLIGSSPEMLVRVEDGMVETRPIAGTRGRGQTAAEDEVLERELVADAKERAEHVMLVDLGRNDVGRVAAAGTVEVSDLMRVERYSHVMHMVSDVRGRLRPDRDSLAALAACFPAGTLTGAPKVRAMEIIDELEEVRRGPYGGCVGYLGFSGNMDTCITIRTIVAVGNRAYVQAGAGVVADSDPEREWEECRNKARALLRAMEAAEAAGAEAAEAGEGGAE